MDLELAKRGPAAAIVYSFAALLFFFFLDLEGKLDVFVKILAVGALLINFVRLRISQKAIWYGTLSNKEFRNLYICIYVNATLWACLYGAVSFQIGFRDIRTIPVIVAFFAMSVAAPFTISYSRSLLVYFIVIWNGPQILVLLYQRFFGSLDFNTFINFTSYFVFNIIYALRQGFSFHEQLFQKFINDIQLEKANAELLESRQKIIEQTAMTQHANRLSELGQMAAGMAHEINTPLAVIQIRADNLQEMLKKPDIDRPKFSEEIGKINSMVFRIAKIIQGLRAFARDSADDPMQPTDISQIVDESLNLCQEKFKHSQIELRVSCSEKFYIDCVPFQIVQVLVNLLSNSFDAVKDLSRPWVEIKAYQHHDHARIDVVDSGYGISDELAPKIMLPFFTTKDVGQGTGLGLSVSKGIIEKHQGNLLYLELEGHTCFRVEIPLKKSTSHS